MKRSRFFILLAAGWLLCALTGAQAEGADCWTRADDSYYHTDAACPGDGEMYPISAEAAEKFGRTPCPACMGWQPYYTGDTAVEWPHESGAWEMNVDFADRQRDGSGSKAADRLSAAMERYGVQDDFCGMYINDSGSLTVLLRAPTEERARQYAKVCGQAIWVIQAEYTEAELNEEFNQAREWLDALPDQGIEVRLVQGSVNVSENTVEIEFEGRDSIEAGQWLGERCKPCVKLIYPALDVREDGEIPHAPVSESRGDGFSARMEPDSYPAGTPRLYLRVEVDGGRLMDYEWKPVLYKYVNGAYERVPMNAAAAHAGTILGSETIMQELSGVKPLGTGLYRLDSCFGSLEFAIRADAAEPALPEAASPAAISVPAHAVVTADELSYNSYLDDTKYAEHVLAGDRIYWIHSVQSNVEVPSESYQLLSAPLQQPEQVSRICGPTDQAIYGLNDLGDALLLARTEGDQTLLLKLSYDGQAETEIARLNGNVMGLRAVGGKIWFQSDQAIYQLDAAGGAPVEVYSTKLELWDSFGFADGRIYVQALDWSHTEDSRIAQIDLQSGRTRSLKLGGACPLGYLDGCLLAWSVKKGEMLLIDGDGRTVRELGELPRLDPLQTTPDGVLAYHTDASGKRIACLIAADGSIRDNLPDGIFYLGGLYWTEDDSGNLARTAL